jgi:hypothetical protein
MEIAELIARYLWPMVLGWNIFLFKGVRAQEQAHAEYKLYVAQNYTSKTDLKDMFDGFERRFDEKFSMVLNLTDNKKQQLPGRKDNERTYCHENQW